MSFGLGGIRSRKIPGQNEATLREGPSASALTGRTDLFNIFHLVDTAGNRLTKPASRTQTVVHDILYPGNRTVIQLKKGNDFAINRHTHYSGTSTVFVIRSLQVAGYQPIIMN